MTFVITFPKESYSLVASQKVLAIMKAQYGIKFKAVSGTDLFQSVAPGLAFDAQGNPEILGYEAHMILEEPKAEAA